MIDPSKGANCTNLNCLTFRSLNTEERRRITHRLSIRSHQEMGGRCVSHSVSMHLAIFLSLAVLCLIHAASSVEARPATPSVIKLTKIDSAYWRATFSDPPLNLQGDAFFQDFYSIVDEITNNSDVKVVVFDSSSREFFSTHVDLINPLSHELWPGNGRYWDCITRLAKAPVLTIAAIRGRAYNAEAEIAAALDVRFGSKERAVLGQLEVGFGKC